MSFDQFSQQLARLLPQHAIITDYAKRYAYATDASFYRLTPKLVLIIENSEQLSQVLSLAHQTSVAVTFRAAGTSLSGQAITDSVLITLSDGWRGYTISEQGHKITLQPGVIGAKANQLLKPYQRKIGPDPASINSCKIGGIAANNASGMCCGVKHNSYHTLADMTIIFADGSVLNTADEGSRASFLASHSQLVNRLNQLKERVTGNSQLKNFIQHKYRLKNTTGYGINALVDFNDPVDVIKHVLIGSEGTLGFIADITYHTVADAQHKSSGIFMFDSTREACELVQQLTDNLVSAVELLDKRALLAVADQPLMPANMNDLADAGVALLIEVTADSDSQLASRVNRVAEVIERYSYIPSLTLGFDSDLRRNEQLWQIRKGTFPAVGANREVGTTVIIEDIAVSLHHLAAVITDLHTLFDKHGYKEAIIFGHALAGNLHFVFTQRFDNQQQIERYNHFMTDVSRLIVEQYQGSLKAEHGTGRNMAPFVALEWGEQAYQVMCDIKQLFDPKNILNPGVIINDDPNAHLKHLKSLPKANDVIDACIECGFCEAVCPSNGLTMTPRQRIAVWRRIVELEQNIVALKHDPVNKQPSQQLSTQITDSNFDELEQEQAALLNDFDYLAIDSCAATGLCGLQCPVGINTGEFILQLRQQRLKSLPLKAKAMNYLAKHFDGATAIARAGINMVGTTQQLIGEEGTKKVLTALNHLTAGTVPLYFKPWPKAAKPHRNGLLVSPYRQANDKPKTIVYLPSCAGRMLSPSSQNQASSLTEVVVRVLHKAGYDVVIPTESASLCCGLSFHSKGDEQSAKQKGMQMHQVAYQASQHGRLPVLIDNASCALHIIESMQASLADIGSFKVYEPAQCIEQLVLPNVTINKRSSDVMLHLGCSSKRLHTQDSLMAVASACAEHVQVSEDVTCCAFAGDKGFYYPELNRHALRHIDVNPVCDHGYSNNIGCEIGLSRHTGMSFQSIFYLLDRVLD
ncbi:FAD-binding and (Fe-S)-binding domain-containing protein [Thalassotalea maritima]|uniref:FAD-binding and (Fe-S)-binding domain-containing protein n=1 Tax=Thalassotalea maritima TaxID=3242416 RepID=UPI003526FB71